MSRLALLLACCIAGASPAAAHELQPFRAEYALLVDGKLQGTTTMQLTNPASGRWLLSLAASASGGLARLAGLRSSQASEFAEHDDSLRLTRSEIRNANRLGTRRVVTELDWRRGEASFSGDLDRDRRGPLALAGTVATRESLNLLLGIAAAQARPGEQLEFQLLDRGSARVARYHALARERVRVPAGEFNAVPVREQRTRRQRSTTAWFAPELPPLPVRVLRTEDGAERYELRLLSWEVVAAPG